MTVQFDSWKILDIYFHAIRQAFYYGLSLFISKNNAMEKVILFT